jgi:hypothetical protein
VPHFHWGAPKSHNTINEISFSLLKIVFQTRSNKNLVHIGGRGETIMSYDKYLIRSKVKENILRTLKEQLQVIPL